ncbi:ABC transporter permease [Undibacterium sp. Ji67W]|uniref:ABC transporter permease n=1 Tax=Undibacterium sp. Ji67W TaxID=3413042 RepID=UPI003BF3F891
MEIRPIFSALMRNKTAPVLVATQIAISLAILTNALYVVQLRQEASARSSGIQDEASVFQITSESLKKTDYNEKLALKKIEKQILTHLPGVLSVAEVNQMPMANFAQFNPLSTDRHQLNPIASAAVYLSGDSLINTLGLQLLEGRDFNASDVIEYDASQDDKAAQSTIITKALARRLFPGVESVIGKSIFMGTGEKAEESKIVGVIDSLQTPPAEFSDDAQFSLIMPLAPALPRNSYAVRTEPGQRDRVMKAAQSALDKNLNGATIIALHTVEEYRKERYRNDNALSSMLITVSGLLLLVSASGIVGMSTLWVAQRRKQIGVRRALGARKLDILRYFLTENFLITSIGIGAGIVMSIGLNQILVSHFEISKLPIIYLLAAPFIFWTMGLCAAYGPSWRAASISPATATRGF